MAGTNRTLDDPSLPTGAVEGNSAFGTVTGGLDRIVTGAGILQYVETEAQIGGLDTISDNTIPLKNGSVFENSSITETDDNIFASKPIVTTTAGSITVSDLAFSSSGDQPCFHNKTLGVSKFASLHTYNTSTGSTNPQYPKSGAMEAITTVDDGTETNATGSLSFVTTIASDYLLSQIQVEVVSELTNAEFVFRRTDENGPELSRQRLATLATGMSVITANPQTFFTTNQVVHISATWDSGSIMGKTSGSEFIPNFISSGFAYTMTELLDEDQADGDLVNVAKPDTSTVRFTRRNGTTIDIDVGTSMFNEPSLSQFASSDLPSRVDPASTTLNATYNFSYFVTNHGNIASLELQVEGGDNKTITNPTTDGSQNFSVQLTNIVASDGVPVTFKLVATDTQTTPETVESNTISVEVRALADHEYFYYGLSSSNNPASVNLSTLTQLEETGTGDYTVSTGLTTAGQYFIVLVPAAETVTRIVDTVFGNDVTNIFTKTDDVRVINSENFDSYVLGPLNAGGNEQYIFTLQ